MIELKKYLEYKLATTEDVNISTASSWIAEFIEIENSEKYIQEFKQWEEEKKPSNSMNVGSYEKALTALKLYHKNMEEKPIDHVTTQNLDTALRLIGVKIESPVLDKIIDLVELLEDKKGNPTLEEITEIEEIWEDYE